MKILFFLNKFPLPSETFIVSQIVGLIERGFEVQIISIEKGDTNNLHGKVRDFHLISKTQYISEVHGGWLKKLVKRAISVLPHFFSRNVLSSFNFKKYGKHSQSLLLAKGVISIKNAKADVIVAHFGTAAVVANKLIELGVIEGKLISIFHGSDISKKKILQEYMADYKDLFNKSSVILPISELWKEKLISLDCLPEKTIVNRMGIDLNQFSELHKRPIEDAIFKVVSVARFVEKKGLEYAISAMSELKKQGVLFEYSIIGTGPLELSLKKQVKFLGLEHNVKFLGFKSQEDVKNILIESNVFLLPSVTAQNGDMEGIPVALMEAMAMGITTVSTYHSGIPELIDNGVSGFLVPERDHLELSKVLYSISQNEPNLATIRSMAIKRIKERFDQSKLYDQLAVIIRSL